MAQNLKDIKAFAYDIDGVMTDGGILAMPDGELLRTYDAKDSFAIRMAVMQGFPVAVITGGRSISILNRQHGCGVADEDVYLGARDKKRHFLDFCSRHNLKPEDVMYFGDDIPDVEVLRMCGVGVTPSDGCAEAKEAADIVSDFPGGKGCVRDAIERTMRAQGKWVFDTAVYEKRF